MITGNDVDDVWCQALRALVERGRETAPRGMKVKELRGVTFLLHDPDENVLRQPGRKLNYYFMTAEWLWMLYGLNDVQTISAYNKQIAQFSDDGKIFFGAYGPQILAQLPRVMDLLRTDPATRQAIVQIWRPEALKVRTKDVPCTLTWQFFIRDNLLELHVNMRSNDIWLGFPYDVFNFTQMQRYLATALGIGVGYYYHHVGSLHLYERHYDDAVRALNEDVTTGKKDTARALPVPSFPAPEELRQLLMGLAAKQLPFDVARSLIAVLSLEWAPYGWMLLHRFTKLDADLPPEYRGLLAA